MIAISINPGFPGDTSPFVSVGFCNDGASRQASIFLTDITPDDLHRLGDELHEAMKRHEAAMWVKS